MAMDQEKKLSQNSNMWKKAATDGLILASVTVIIVTLNSLIETKVTGVLFSILKFAGSIYLLYKFMKKYSQVSNKQSTFKYGFLTCCFSAIICAAYTFFMLTVLFPETVTQTFNTMLEMFNGSDEQQNILLKIEDNFPQLMFFSSLIWDIIIGLIVSAIISSSISKNKEFFPTTTDVEE